MCKVRACNRLCASQSYLLHIVIYTITSLSATCFSMLARDYRLAEEIGKRHGGRSDHAPDGEDPALNIGRDFALPDRLAAAGDDRQTEGEEEGRSAYEHGRRCQPCDDHAQAGEEHCGEHSM